MKDKELRVLQLIDTLEPGGAERMAVNLANGLLGHVALSCLCSTRKEGALYDSLNPQVSYLFLKKKKTLDLSAISRLYAFVKKHGITHIHAHSSSFFLATLLVLILPKVKLVWHDHYGNSEHLETRSYVILRWCSNYFDHIYCVNDVLLEWAKKKLNCSSVSYLPNFVIKSLKPQKLISPLCGQNGKRILCLANLRPQKGHLKLFRTFMQLTLNYPDWTLHCVGKDFNDAYSKHLRQELRLLDLEHSVFLYGIRVDIEAIIEACDICVLASYSEGLPLALLEYGHGGKAVVVTDVGDCKKVLPDDSYGKLIPLESEQVFLEALEYYVKNPIARQETGLVLKEHVASHFSESVAITKLVELFHTV